MSELTDKMSLVCSSHRYSVYYSAKGGFDTYVLTLRGRRDCWLMIENIYKNGTVRRSFRFCKPKYFNFTTGTWFRHNPYSDTPCPEYVV